MCPTRVFRWYLDTSNNPPTGDRPEGLLEVEGIEPSSFSFSMGLLRAQPVEDLGPPTFTGNGERPQSAEVSRNGPLTRPFR